MIQGMYTTAANEHDSKGLIPLLRELPEAKKKQVWTDIEASSGISKRCTSRGVSHSKHRGVLKRPNACLEKLLYAAFNLKSSYMFKRHLICL